MTTSLPELDRLSSAVSVRAAIAFGDWPPRPFHECGYAADIHHGDRCPSELEARAADGDR